MNQSRSGVWWWVGWILLTIAAFFVSCYFWTGFIARHVGSMQKTGAPILWVTAVFGSWMVLLIPLIIVMYQKVDKAYEDARLAREKVSFEKAQSAFRVKSAFLETADRWLDKTLVQKLGKIPEAVRNGHLVTAVLKDGRRVENVFVRGRKEVLGVYGVETPPFRAGEIADIEPVDLDRLPDFKPEKWLRLDGVGTP